MLQLLVGVVQQDGLERLVVGVVGALLVPVDGLELFHEGHDGVVHVQGLGAETVARDMEFGGRHGGLRRRGVRSQLHRARLAAPPAFVVVRGRGGPQRSLDTRRLTRKAFARR